MPLPSRRPAVPRRPVRHPDTRSNWTQTGSSGFRGPAVKPSITPTAASPRAAASTPTNPIGPPPLPADPAYDQQVGAIDRRTQQTVSGLTGERDRTLLDYGYNVQYDANGEPITSTLTFDPTNVFSRAAQLRKRWMEARTGTQNGMAAQGQLNSGAYGRAQRQVNYGESAATDAEIKGLTDFLARNSGTVAAARTQAEMDKGTAMGERIGRIPTNPLYDPTRSVGPAGTAPGGAGPADYNARPYRTQVVPGKGEWHVYPNGKRVFVRYK